MFLQQTNNNSDVSGYGNGFGDGFGDGNGDYSSG